MEFYNFFSFSAKKAIYRASEICTQFNNQYLEPEHIFYSILNLRSCGAVQMLNSLGALLPKITYSLEAYLYEHAGSFKGNAVFSQRTISLLDVAYREVKRMHHREIGTAHLVIALAQDRTEFLHSLFEDNGLDVRRLREAFLQQLKGHSAGESEGADQKGPVASSRHLPLLPDFAVEVLETSAQSALILGTRLSALFGQESCSLICLLGGLCLELEAQSKGPLSRAGADGGKLLQLVVAAIEEDRSKLREKAPEPADGLAEEVSTGDFPAPADFDSDQLDEVIKRLVQPSETVAPIHPANVQLSSELARVLGGGFERAVLRNMKIGAGMLLASLLAFGDPRIEQLLKSAGYNPATGNGPDGE